jgi:hypothetical protein
MVMDRVGESVLAAWCAELERLRADRLVWREVAYEQGDDEHGDECDRHELARARVLWALQYQATPGDLPLLRFLLGEATTARREDPFQGCGEELELAGLLVAEHRQLDDVELQWQAKTANFDTWCGYDLGFVLAAGAADTVAFVRAGALADREALLARITDDHGAPAMSDQAVNDWLLSARSRFPRDPAEEAPRSWMDRLRRLGETEAARHYLRLWAAGLPQDDPRALGSLQRELAEFGDFAGAAAVQRQALALTHDPRERAASLQRLAELTRLSGDFGAAWQSLQDCLLELEQQPGWRKVGWGRSFVQEHFLLAAATGDGALARVVLDAGHQHAATVPGLPFTVLDTAVSAAVRVGDDTLTGYYTAMRDAERQRIDHALQ